MAYTAPRTWVAGETVTAALMNTHLRDNLLAIYALATATWTAYTPTLTNMSVGAGTLSGKYINFGKLYVARVDVILGAGFSVSGNVSALLPATAPAGTGSPILGVGEAIDSSVSQSWDLRLRIASTTTVSPVHSDGASAAVVAATTPFTWASGDELHLLIIHEAA